MTRTPEIVENVPADKKRSVWKPLAAAGIGGAVLVATGFGVFAQLNATATSLENQGLSSGTLRLALNKDGLGNSQASFSTELSKLAPGDTVNRLVTLSSTGTLAGQLPTLQLTENAVATAGPLTAEAGRGLQVSITKCSAVWTPALNGGTPTCASPATTSPVYTGTVAGMQAAAVPLTNIALTPEADNFLLVSMLLPNAANEETTVNGTIPAPQGGTIQGRTSSLTWTFRDQQRTATTFNGGANNL